MSKRKTLARLDPFGTEQPKTKLIGPRPARDACFNPTKIQPLALQDTDTGEVIPLYGHPGMMKTRGREGQMADDASCPKATADTIKVGSRDAVLIIHGDGSAESSFPDTECVLEQHIPIVIALLLMSDQNKDLREEVAQRLGITSKD